MKASWWTENMPVLAAAGAWVHCACWTFLPGTCMRTRALPHQSFLQCV